MSEQNSAFIRRYLEALSGKDKPAELIAEFVTDQELIDHIMFFESAFPAYQLTAEVTVAEDDRVAVYATFRGTHHGDLMGVAPTGKEVTLPVMLIYRIAEGKIVQHWMSVDRMALMHQLAPESVAA